ncbi:MAG: hypothetical protein N2C14_31035 [Planctomycetales bacterium]
MALLTDDIESVLESNGRVAFKSEVTGEELVTNDTGDEVVKRFYNQQKLTASAGENLITMTRVASSATDNNCIDIRTLDSVSAIGKVTIPGYVYTGNFSGCVFYLYKTGIKEVTGVHAYSGEVTTKTKRFLRKPKVTKVVREFGPTDYFLRNPGTMICRYPTSGELDPGAYTGDPAGETSLAFLSCVETNCATTFLFSVKASMLAPEFTVRRLLAKHFVEFG